MSKQNNKNSWIINQFPKSYDLFKKINIYITVILLILFIIYLILCIYLNNPIMWYCTSIWVFLILFAPLLLSKINCNITIKQFKKNLYLHENMKDKDTLIKIDYKRFYKKRTNFKEELIAQVCEQLL